MKKKSVCLVGIFLLILSSIEAQQKVIDSLEQQLLIPTNGLSKIEILNELSWYYAHSDIGKGIAKADSAINMAIKKGDSLQLGIAYERKGFNYQNQGKDSLTIVMYELAEEIYRYTGQMKRLATLAFNKGNFYLFRSDYQKSLDVGQKALSIFIKNADTIKISRAYNQIALNYLYLGDYNESLNTFQKGSLILDQNNKSQTASYGEIQGNVGLLYEKLSDYQTALKFQNKALIIYKKNNYQRAIANTYNNLGKLYGLLDDQEKALEMFDLSYQIKKKNGNKYRISNALVNFGVTHYALKNYNLALDYFNQAKAIYKKLGHQTNLSTVYKNIGDVYLDKRQPKKAAIYFDTAIVYAKSIKDKRATYLAKQGRAKAYFATANYKSAYTLQQESQRLKENLLSNDKRDELAKLKAKYKYEKEKVVLEANFVKNKALDEAKIEQQTLLKNISIGGGILGMLILTTGFILIKRKKEADFNAKVAVSELQTLKAQLSPHFIFNSLNSINDYVQKNEKDKASTYLIKFSSMMRKILDNSKEEEVSLNEEIEFLDNYIRLERQRLENIFEYSIKVTHDIHKEEIFVPPTLFQPFVENSIWHGLSEKKENGYLSIKFSKDQNILICTIDDNGAGMKIKQGNNKSFGTGSAKNRIDILNKLNGTDAKIEFIEKEQGVRVTIRLPIFL